MSFSFDTSLGSDLDLVRFNIGDTTEEGAYLQDETITALLTSEGSVGGAVVASIKYIITQLATPNFKKDWLSVDYEKARKGFEDLLLDKALEFDLDPFGVQAASDVALPRRMDSYQDDDSFTSTDADEEKSYYSGDA